MRRLQGYVNLALWKLHGGILECNLFRLKVSGYAEMEHVKERCSAISSGYK
jgi:hypothetical protein